jgi:dTDP-4-amino-4,6-dideoxygalactose transaminase
MSDIGDVVVAPRIPFLDLASAFDELAPDIEQALLRVARSGWYLLGSELATFETSFATFVESNFAAGCGNGLDAIELALRAWEIGPGDEVIVPANTYIATWLAVSRVGARIVPCEPDDDTFNIDPRRVEELLTARTRAILAVHLYGQPADLTALRAVADAHGLILLEDAAQAHGAAAHGRRIGSGQGVAWSFYPGKNLGALGDGGAVTTDDPQVDARIRRLRNYGSAIKYQNEEIGTNSRLDEIQAAVLSVKLAHLKSWNKRREDIASAYLSGLADCEHIRLPHVPAWADPVWHLFVVRSPHRDELANSLRRLGVDTLLHYPVPPHRQPAYFDLGMPEGAYPISERMHREVLSLPIGPHLTQDAVVRIIDGVRRFTVATSP